MARKKRISQILQTGIKEVFQKNGGDFYHETLKVSHPMFLGIFITVFLSLNTFFGLIYYIVPNTITGPRVPNFIDCFSFSVQTMGTVGYGTFYPTSLLAHVLVTIEVMIGLVGIGTFAALAFARISLPNSKLTVSNKLLINEDDGEPTLLFRVAHLRQNFLVDVHISLQILYAVKNWTGQIEMVLEPLQLEHDFYHVLTGVWLIKHHINEESQLFGKSSSELKKQHSSLIATITGTDGTTSESVSFVHSYSPDDIIWNQRFKSIAHENQQTGELTIDHTLINEMESSKFHGKPKHLQSAIKKSVAKHPVH
jgi:inward rectifier potassium channel